MLDHFPGGCLTQEESRLLIDLDDIIPIFFREFDGRRPADDAGAIDENVDASVLFQRGIDNLRDDFGVDQIGLDAEATPAQGLDFFDGFLKTGAAGDHDEVGACFGKTDGHARAQAAAGAGDNRHFTGKIELFEDHDAKLLSKIYRNLPDQFVQAGKVPLKTLVRKSRMSSALTGVGLARVDPLSEFSTRVSNSAWKAAAGTPIAANEAGMPMA